MTRDWLVGLVTIHHRPDGPLRGTVRLTRLGLLGLCWLKDEPWLAGLDHAVAGIIFPEQSLRICWVVLGSRGGITQVLAGQQRSSKDIAIFKFHENRKQPSGPVGRLEQ